MKISSIIKKNKIRITIYGILLLIIGYAFLIEPKWIHIEHITLSSHPRYQLVHISDIHFHGDKSFLNEIVNRINDISPDFVCFTGDLIDEKEKLTDALSILEKIRCPIFGVPGNHDYWSGASFDTINESFRKTGGFWILDKAKPLNDIEIIGLANESYKKIDPTGNTFTKRILLTHYPEIVKQIHNQKYDLILAGHSHGGQVRLPILGALKVPYGVGEYDRGLYATKAGALYVSPGLGTYGIHLRLLCRPEITVIEF
ncbi:conserved exported hypothetical protein [Desulfamplus magnetovallimortis]|uniref:Calcineurin-like phosphoesterase domain-containing protein n=1 Tax=Desulfamplus magnetovallimortis TaxID=1246637 RepID=A0A1W1HBC2_9BACT|nr:metallophosphoesterase [Desulfamplus magnetovallimortis]SLM29801.1 conserved exported hypothetical protein [Desulfamplus magnetovallimortis]